MWRTLSSDSTRSSEVHVRRQIFGHQRTRNSLTLRCGDLFSVSMIPIDTSNIKETDMIRCFLYSFWVVLYVRQVISIWMIETIRRDFDHNWLSIGSRWCRHNPSGQKKNFFTSHPRHFDFERHWPSTSKQRFHTRVNYEEKHLRKYLLDQLFLLSRFFEYFFSGLR